MKLLDNMDDNKMQFSDYLWAAFIFLLAMAAVSCTYDRFDDECLKGEPIPGTVCIELYDPVVAPDGTQYPNSCYAQSDGWENGCLIKKGEW